ncbi:hypothetical protein MS3_00010318 [Schistosoma haematobium]|uniref:G-protein coupled receptors family 1 profile domain-containing protein n=2 Tax=Schistosoma TaxID=6181 RepID=A0A095BUS4_SCHHA|nr:hypothetical protein MS3_00010318 [Schistosoma haematobium]KAH9590143.1 hypothetical protein MS3_00010318 [Schistosoma haematobium]CAH8651505.1 unnamed protein product [Schistosoma haematobium]CAH8658488.1 unnamed protein product [Schistosoma haematobium]
MFPYDKLDEYFFYDTPTDLLATCGQLNVNSSQVYKVQCIVTKVLGIWSAYLLPIICGLGLITHSLVITIIFKCLKYTPRQLIYTGCLSCSNILTNILFAWLWLFPAKGLPYITNGQIYYFIFNTSRIACRLCRFTYSLSTTLTSNLILCSAIDRCLSIYFPVKLLHLSNRHAWYICLIVLIISSIMMSPFLIVIDWIQVGQFHICWIEESLFHLQIYHTLFANLGLVQSILIVMVNIAFITRLIIQTRRTRHTMAHNKKELKHISISIILLAFSMSYVLTALPQTTVYLLAFLWSYTNEVIDEVYEVWIRLMYNLADIGWNLHFTRELIDLIMYFIYLKPLRRILLYKIKKIINIAHSSNPNTSDHASLK